MSDSDRSEWSEANELQCLIIFKRLYVEDFPHGRQIEYCRDLATRVDISPERLSHKVSSYKAAAGMNELTDASANTIRLYKKHRHTSIRELEAIVSGL